MSRHTSSASTPIPRRHPLQELVVDTFVPNDAFIAGGNGASVAPEGEGDAVDCDTQDRNSIVVCTGANACGKASLVISAFDTPLIGRLLECVHQTGRYDSIHGASKPSYPFPPYNP